jgi:CobQ/CobB/MinD/ParA nucleotide binding domain.
MVLVFVTSDKGGTGRSVTSCNIAYRTALASQEACYLDFDFGSPTAGAIFNITSVASGVERDGLHSYLHGRAATPVRFDVWASSDRQSLRQRPPGAAQLVLVPGDHGGSEFPNNPEVNRRCAELFSQMEEEFDLTIVDLSAGRSYATDMVLAATAMPNLRKITARWLVFHRWTRQHVAAAANLVYDEGGILATGERHGHDPQALADSIRFVRTAVIDPFAKEVAELRPSQVAFLRSCDQELNDLAKIRNVGRTKVISVVPLDPLLQWREQLISNNDVWESKIANTETVAAFEDLAKSLMDDKAWEIL